MLKVLWGVTITASLIFVIQSVMTFLGADSDTDMDSSFDMDADMSLDSDTGGVGGHSGMNLYTFRNFVNFFLGFGWTCVLLYDQVKPLGALLVFGVVVGIALVVAVMYLFKWLAGMQQSGNIDVWKSAVGCQGIVYLTIPGERKGEGKVQITINNAVREYQAMTEFDTIKTGTPIKVVEVVNEHTLLVEELATQIV